MRLTPPGKSCPRGPIQARQAKEASLPKKRLKRFQTTAPAASGSKRALGGKRLPNPTSDLLNGSNSQTQDWNPTGAQSESRTPTKENPGWESYRRNKCINANSLQTSGSKRRALSGDAKVGFPEARKHRTGILLEHKANRKLRQKYRMGILPVK
jgi:hypothetical protein